jgi:hypothetical protein
MIAHHPSTMSDHVMMTTPNAVNVRVIATMMTSAQVACFVGSGVHLITLLKRTSLMDVLGLPLTVPQIIVYPLTGMLEH